MKRTPWIPFFGRETCIHPQTSVYERCPIQEAITSRECPHVFVMSQRAESRSVFGLPSRFPSCKGCCCFHREAQVSKAGFPVKTLKDNQYTRQIAQTFQCLHWTLLAMLPHPDPKNTLVNLPTSAVGEGGSSEFYFVASQPGLLVGKKLLLLPRKVNQDTGIFS